jgi:uncharacterized protein YjbI with pentapeptide repeats
MKPNTVLIALIFASLSGRRSQRSSRRCQQTQWRFLLLSFLVVVPAFLPHAMYANDSTTLPVEHERRCKADPQKEWTAQERWVWQKICLGETADFNGAAGVVDGFLDPAIKEQWPKNRIIRSRFLETILLDEPFRSALTHHGVRIWGAWLREPLNLSGGILPTTLQLQYSRFESDVDFSSTRTSFPLSFEGSFFSERLNMIFLRSDSSVDLSRSRLAKTVLCNASIGGALAINRSTSVDDLNLCEITVSRAVVMRGSKFQNVDLHGSRIGGSLEISSCKSCGSLLLDSSDIGGSVLLSGGSFRSVLMRHTTIRHILDMNHSVVRGVTNLDSANVGASIFMKDASFHDELVLNGVKVGGTIEMDGSHCQRPVKMDSIQSGGSVFLRGRAKFGDVSLRSAQIGGQLSTVESKFTGNVDMGSIKVGKALVVSRSQFKHLDIHNGEIGGNVVMEGTSFVFPFNVSSLKVGGDLLMRQIVFPETASGRIVAVFSNIGGSIDLSATNLPSLDLTGTRIGRELRLGSKGKPIHWVKDAQLSLRNTVTDVLHDDPETWPKTIYLEGFTYSRHGGLEVGDSSSTNHRDVQWFLDWLSLQPQFTSQPYEQLAQFLRSAGQDDAARDVLYEGREEARHLAKGTTWFNLTLQKYVIGYGYRNYYSLWWILLMLFIGCVVIYYAEGRHRGVWWSFWYSVDRLLPAPTLDKDHGDIAIRGMVRGYFYFHQLMGYFLALFLVAGLTGLTK